MVNLQHNGGGAHNGIILVDGRRGGKADLGFHVSRSFFGWCVF